MEPESKFKLEELFKMVEENNKLLKKMKRTQEIGQLMRVIYWLVILGTALGAYYFVQPYVDQVKDLYGGASDTVNGFGSLFGGIEY